MNQFDYSGAMTQADIRQLGLTVENVHARRRVERRLWIAFWIIVPLAICALAVCR